MRKRDISIVLLSCFGLFLSLENEGSISYRKAWYHHTGHEDGKLAEFEAQDALPAPVVVDLNGDGGLEVVVVTHDYNLQLIKPQPPGRAGEGFAPAEVLAQVSLLPGKISIGLDRHPVALAAGYLDPEPREKVRPPRKQVLAVVTAGWRVMLYDHNLALMWEGDAGGGGGVLSGRGRARLHEVAVAVTPHRVRGSDRGLVVVGGAAALSVLAEEAAGTDAAPAAGKGRAGGVLEGVFEDELRWEAGGISAGGGGAGAAGRVGAVPLTAGAGADTSRHFDYFAFEGGGGEPRWEHRAGSFHGGEELEAASEELAPQHSFKLDAEKLAGRHYGELSCREFRESVLHALPHHWAAPPDTRLEAAAFFRHREGAGAQKGQLAAAAAARAASAGRASGSAARAPSSSWLFGSHRTRGSAAAAARAREQAGAGARHAHLAHNSSANALVAHLQQGLEVVHLFTGRALCELHLAPGQLHADFNGDGVVDHVALSPGGRAAADAAAPLLHHVASARHAGLGPCAARATSGVPPNEELWVADVCARRRSVEEALLPMRGDGDDGGGFTNSHGPGAAAVAFAAPAFLPVPRADGSYSHLRGQHGIVGILSSDGVVTALSRRGERLWQRFMEVGWDEDATPDAVPSLLPLALRARAVPAALLAVGADAAAVVSEHGAELARLRLEFPPLGPPLAADFDGDGLTDLLFATPGGLFGYAQVQHLGGLNLGALLLALMVAMGIVWWGQAQGETLAGGARARASCAAPTSTSPRGCARAWRAARGGRRRASPGAAAGGRGPWDGGSAQDRCLL
ncbi:MAG: hypothetical protein J3K34DRAFT_285487 [Monoraphidium minutum]|nr:MAG: hypothetical protein J3K34DRAFT_285487 [Monoraphidium minutum]